MSDVAAFDALSAATATVAAHCATLATISRWLIAQGVESGAASDYVASLFAGLAPALRAGCDLDALASDHATPGGINELFREHLAEAAVPQTVERGAGPCPRQGCDSASRVTTPQRGRKQPVSVLRGRRRGADA